MPNQFIREYLTFTKKERTGIFILILIILICIFLPLFYPLFIHNKKYDYSEFEKEITQLKVKEIDTSRKYYVRNFNERYQRYPHNYKHYSNEQTNEQYELFNFDPNTASAEDWKRLGIREKTIETIQKYISKGGHFYNPEDLTKIWGLRNEDLQRLMPYVTIHEIPKEEQHLKENKTLFTSFKKNTATNIDINSADSSAFMALPGIGVKLAARILNFRNRLGGFYSVEQVKETYGLPDSTFSKIKPLLLINTNSLKQININTADVDALRSHPYIRYNIANAIVQYRNQHGNFSSVSEIKNIMIITEGIYNKVSPYLTVN